MATALAGLPPYPKPHQEVVVDPRVLEVVYRAGDEGRELLEVLRKHKAAGAPPSGAIAGALRRLSGARKWGSIQAPGGRIVARRHPGAHAAGGDEEIERLQHVAGVDCIVVGHLLVPSLDGGEEGDEALLREAEGLEEVAVVAEDHPHGGEGADNLVGPGAGGRREGVGGVEALGHGVCEGEDVELPDEARLEDLRGRMWVGCAEGEGALSRRGQAWRRGGVERGVVAGEEGEGGARLLGFRRQRALEGGGRPQRPDRQHGGRAITNRPSCKVRGRRAKRRPTVSPRAASPHPTP